MSETDNTRRLPSISNDNDFPGARESFVNNDRLDNVISIIPRIVEMYRKTEMESRKKESLETLKRERQLDKNQLLGVNIQQILTNQIKSVELLGELLNTIKGLKTNSNNGNGRSGSRNNLLSPGIGRAVAGAAGLAFGGAIANEILDYFSENNNENLNESAEEEQAPEQVPAEEPLPIPPIPPEQISAEEPLPIPPIPPEQVSAEEPLQSQSVGVTRSDTVKAGVLSDDGKILPLPSGNIIPSSVFENYAIPSSNPMESTRSLVTPASSSLTLNTNEKDSNNQEQSKNNIASRVKTKSKNENNASPFGRDLTLKAKSIVFSGDNIEFDQDNRQFGGGMTTPTSNPIMPMSSPMSPQTNISGGATQSGEAGGGMPISDIVQAGAGFNVVRYNDGRVERRTGSRNWRNNNPGNLEYGDLARRYGAIGSDGRFAIFPTYEMGRRAKEALLFEGRGYQGLTIAQAITRYAPPNENDTGNYINTITAAVGVPANTLLQNLNSQQRQAMLAAMERVEGFRQGRVEVLQQGSGSTGAQQVGAEMQQTQSAEAGGGATLMAPSGGGVGTGAQVAAASQENSVAERTPAPPSITAVGGETPSGPNPSVGPPNYFNSPNDPGNVEPADAAERYSRLFNMAA